MSNNQAARKILNDNPTQAAGQLIKISRTLLGLAERETQALVQNDLISFSILQDEKELITERYTKASEEFRGRVEEFRGIDVSLLNQMENIQKELAEKTHANNSIVTKMRQRSEQKTHATLFTAQELAQQKPMRFANVNEERI